MTAGAALHPRNRGFVWHDPAPPYRRIDAGQAEAWSRDGGFVLTDAFRREEIAAVTAAIDPLEAETEAFLAGRPGGRHGIARAGEITFRPHLVERSGALRAFSKHPLLLDLVHDLVGRDVRVYWDQSVYKKPAAEDEFPWHQDNGYNYVEPQQYLTCWVALTDATAENGCPWIVPGGHRRGTLEHEWTPLGFRCCEAPANAVALPLRAGSIAVFSSLTPHRTGPNRTDAVRKAYILQYALDGAIMYPRDGAPLRCDAPARQYPVLVAGVPA